MKKIVAYILWTLLIFAGFSALVWIAVTPRVLVGNPGNPVVFYTSRGGRFGVEAEDSLDLEAGSPSGFLLVEEHTGLAIVGEKTQTPIGLGPYYTAGGDVPVGATIWQSVQGESTYIHLEGEGKIRVVIFPRVVFVVLLVLVGLVASTLAWRLGTSWILERPSN